MVLGLCLATQLPGREAVPQWERDGIVAGVVQIREKIDKARRWAPGWRHVRWRCPCGACGPTNGASKRSVGSTCAQVLPTGGCPLPLCGEEGVLQQQGQAGGSGASLQALSPPFCTPFPARPPLQPMLVRLDADEEVEEALGDEEALRVRSCGGARRRRSSGGLRDPGWP